VRWLNKLKVAVVTKDVPLLDELLSSLPDELEDEERVQVLYLLKEGAKMISALQENTLTTMVQIKKNLDFLNSSDGTKVRNTLDIKL
jgi:hypothetical protein